MPGIDRPPTDIVSAPASPERWRNGFWALMATQFQGAFADNTLKQLVIFLVMARHLPKAELDKIVSDAGIYFAIPFLLFSAYGGWMADRFSKAGVMRAVQDRRDRHHDALPRWHWRQDDSRFNSPGFA